MQTCTLTKGLFILVMKLNGPNAERLCVEMADKIGRFLAGDETLVAEIRANAGSSLPVHQVMRTAMAVEDGASMAVERGSTEVVQSSREYVMALVKQTLQAELSMIMQELNAKKNAEFKCTRQMMINDRRREEKKEKERLLYEEEREEKKRKHDKGLLETKINGEVKVARFEAVKHASEAKIKECDTNLETVKLQQSTKLEVAKMEKETKDKYADSLIKASEEKTKQEEERRKYTEERTRFEREKRELTLAEKEIDKDIRIRSEEEQTKRELEKTKQLELQIQLATLERQPATFASVVSSGPVYTGPVTVCRVAQFYNVFDRIPIETQTKALLQVGKLLVKEPYNLVALNEKVVDLNNRYQVNQYSKSDISIIQKVLEAYVAAERVNLVKNQINTPSISNYVNKK